MEKTHLYFKIILIHLVVYYIVFGLIFQSLVYWYGEWDFLKWEFLGKILASPLVGALLGFYDGFSFYIFLTVFFLIFQYSNMKNIKTYIVSALLVYVLGLYLYTLVMKEPFETNIMSHVQEENLHINMLFLIIPSLLASSLSVWAFLKYKSIGV